MKKLFFGWIFFLVFISAGCGSTASQTSLSEKTDAGRPDMTGTWVLQVETAGGSGSPAFELTQKGSALTGTYQGAFGEAPLQGTVTGDSFVIEFKSSGIPMTYTGTVEGDKMEGTIDFGGQGKGTFTGQKI